MKKKLLSCLLSLTVLATVVAVPQKTYAADSTSVGENVTATLSDDGTTVTFSGNGEIVQTLDETGFSTENITTLVFEEGITSIAPNFLIGADNITGTLTLPSTLETIGEYAFSGAEFTGDLDIPEGVTSIGEQAFYEAGFTGTLTLPSTLKTIDNEAFTGTGFTGTLVIPDSVETIGERAFSAMTAINRIEIGSGVTSIGDAAFFVYPAVDTEIVTANEVALAYDWAGDSRQATFSETTPTPTPGAGSSITVQDGAGTGTTTMNGKVSTITQIDVTVPIGGINFVIDEDGQIHAQGIVIESNTAIPLSVNMVSVSPLAAGDETDGLGATTHKAPELVLANKYTADEWNNLTKAQTEAEIAISLKQVDITPEGEAGAELTEATTDALKVSTPVELGDLSVKKSLAHLESGYGTPAKCAINLETSKDFTNYGKAWLSASDITFRYLTTLEFAFDNM